MECSEGGPRQQDVVIWYVDVAIGNNHSDETFFRFFGTTRAGGWTRRLQRGNGKCGAAAGSGSAGQRQRRAEKVIRNGQHGRSSTSELFLILVAIGAYLPKFLCTERAAHERDIHDQLSWQQGRPVVCVRSVAIHPSGG